MAYRHPNDRRELASSPQAPSHLDDFLDHIESLPSTTRSTFQQIRQCDDRVHANLVEADAAVKEAVLRATTKGVALENVKRTTHDLVHLQATAAELADKKVTLARQAGDSIATAIEDLDARLVEFEAQLRKEGRWPSADNASGKEPKTTSGRSSAHAGSGVLPARPPPARSPPARSPPARSPPPEAPPARTVGGGRAGQRGRRRESVTGIAPTTPRAAAMAAARAAEEAEAAATAAADVEVAEGAEDGVEKDAEGDVVMDAGGDQAAIDTTPYCVCRKMSSGNMIACEGKNCVIEWFHFECVGLKDTPTGLWYCPDCAASNRKKAGSGRRKAS